MMCDGDNLKIQEQQNNRNQENKEKNSQSEELKKKRSMRHNHQDSVEARRPDFSHDEAVESHSLRDINR
ncbi:unnamed protein product [Leuciscus chuanchicus]